MNKFVENWKTKDYLIYITIIIPVVSTILTLIFAAINQNAIYSNWGIIFFNAIYPTTIIWSGCFAIVTILWKHFPWERNPLKHLVLEIIAIAIYLFLFILLMLYINNITTIGKISDTIQHKGLEMFNTYLITYLITAIHEAYYFYKQWLANFSKSVKLEKENLQSQYNALKAQINPHFLFNSLNSLISLVEHNPKAEKYIQDLSEFLRFVLQSSSKETVSLEEELSNLEKYIRLLELRFEDNFKVEINIDDENLKFEIPPLALQILVENCVQHNIITSAKPLVVQIFSHNETISVWNKLQKKQKSESTGQGLKNIIGRYQFHNANELKIQETEDSFCVTLPLIKNL